MTDMNNEIYCPGAKNICLQPTHLTQKYTPIVPIADKSQMLVVAGFWTSGKGAIEI